MWFGGRIGRGREGIVEREGMKGIGMVDVVDVSNSWCVLCDFWSNGRWSVF
jgi:hypothetical protein